MVFRRTNYEWEDKLEICHQSHGSSEYFHISKAQSVKAELEQRVKTFCLAPWKSASREKMCWSHWLSAFWFCGNYFLLYNTTLAFGFEYFGLLSGLIGVLPWDMAEYQWLSYYYFTLNLAFSVWLCDDVAGTLQTTLPRILCLLASSGSRPYQGIGSQEEKRRDFCPSCLLFLLVRLLHQHFVPVSSFL